MKPKRILTPNRLQSRLSRRDFLKLSTLGLAGVTLSSSLTSCGWLEEDDIYDVVIVGGGLSGLMAAYFMSDANILLLEKETSPGGRILSNDWEGLTYSMGAAYMGKPDLLMSAFFLDLGIKPIPIPPPADAIAHGGLIYPEGYSGKLLGSIEEYRDYYEVSQELYRLNELGIEDAVYDADIEALAEFAEYDQLSVEKWLNNMDIGPMVQRFIEVENRGLFGTPNSEFSLLWDIPEMAYNLYEGEMDESEFDLGPVPDFHTYQPDVEDYEADVYTFKNGMMEIVWALQELNSLDGKIQTGTEATSISVDGDGIVSVTYTRNGSSQTVQAYAAVLATPAPVTASIVMSGLSSNVMQALRSVEYTTYVTMALHTSERMFRNAWNIACLDTPFTTLNDAVRTQVPYDYDGKSIMGVAMPPEKSNDRSLIQMSDDALMEHALVDIERYFPTIRDKILGRDIHRFQYAFPVFKPHYGDILWELHTDQSTMGPLFLAGDYMVYPTLGGAAVSGWRAFELVSEYAETLE